MSKLDKVLVQARQEKTELQKIPAPGVVSVDHEIEAMNIVNDEPPPPLKMRLDAVVVKKELTGPKFENKTEK